MPLQILKVIADPPDCGDKADSSIVFVPVHWLGIYLVLYGAETTLWLSTSRMKCILIAIIPVWRTLYREFDEGPYNQVLHSSTETRYPLRPASRGPSMPFMTIGIAHSWLQSRRHFQDRRESSSANPQFATMIVLALTRVQLSLGCLLAFVRFSGKIRPCSVK